MAIQQVTFTPAFAGGDIPRVRQEAPQLSAVTVDAEDNRLLAMGFE